MEQIQNQPPRNVDLQIEHQTIFWISDGGLYTTELKHTCQ